jgi:tRNA1(Val) A37 N6-methylase TrmN6
VRFALATLRAKGGVVFIHRADRIEKLLALLAGRTGEIVIFPLWPGGDRPARRVIVRARKGMATPTRLLPGLVLHDDSGHFTVAADQVLRHGAALAFG